MKWVDCRKRLPRKNGKYVCKIICPHTCASTGQYRIIEFKHKKFVDSYIKHNMLMHESREIISWLEDDYDPTFDKSLKPFSCMGIISESLPAFMKNI